MCSQTHPHPHILLTVALEQYNEILESPTAMGPKYSDVADVDTLRPTEAAADIASLLQSVTGMESLMDADLLRLSQRPAVARFVGVGPR